MSNTTKYLMQDLGFADTRAYSLESAVRSIHCSVVQLDEQHLRTLAVHFPEAAALARRYAVLEDSGLNRLDSVVEFLDNKE